MSQGLHFFLFAVLPYLATAIFLLVTIQRYRTQKFSYSSLSSQLLENRQHFWGTVPFHYGLIVVRYDGSGASFTMDQSQGLMDAANHEEPHPYRYATRMPVATWTARSA